MPNVVRIKHSTQFADIVNQLLEKVPSQRLGTNGGANAILEHPWFTDETAYHYISVEDVRSQNKRVPPKDYLPEGFFNVRNDMQYFGSKLAKFNFRESEVNLRDSKIINSAQN